MLHTLISAIPVLALRQRLALAVLCQPPTKATAGHAAILALSRVLPRLALVAKGVDGGLALLRRSVDLGVARAKVGAELVCDIDSLWEMSEIDELAEKRHEGTSSRGLLGSLWCCLLFVGV